MVALPLRIMRVVDPDTDPEPARVSTDCPALPESIREDPCLGDSSGRVDRRDCLLGERKGGGGPPPESGAVVGLRRRRGGGVRECIGWSASSASPNVAGT